MQTVLLVMGAALVLAGCSGGSKGGNSSSSAGAGATGGQEAQEPENLSEDRDNMAVPVLPPSPTPVAAIPAAFQGRWGLVAADCDPAKADVAKGLMTIAGDRLTFYESRGTASHVHQLGAGQIAFDLPMSGEGSNWSEPTRLTLQGDGRTLVRQASGSPDRAGAFPYQRCPA